MIDIAKIINETRNAINVYASFHPDFKSTADVADKALDVLLAEVERLRDGLNYAKGQTKEWEKNYGRVYAENAALRRERDALKKILHCSCKYCIHWKRNVDCAYALDGTCTGRSKWQRRGQCEQNQQAAVEPCIEGPGCQCEKCADEQNQQNGSRSAGDVNGNESEG